MPGEHGPVPGATHTPTDPVSGPPPPSVTVAMTRTLLALMKAVMLKPMVWPSPVAIEVKTVRAP